MACVRLPGVADDGHRDAGAGDPSSPRLMLYRGIGAAAAANETTRETTADKNASRSIPPR